MDIGEKRRLLGDTQKSQIKTDLINRKTLILPKYSPQKPDLPKRSDYIGANAWLRAVRDCIKEPVVFALDEALMCQGYFCGRNDEFLVWVYGNDSVARFNGVVVLGNQINPCYVESKNGINCTNFNRTLYDALANESLLDMQGITEALSRYYYCHGESFDGIFVAPEYQTQFEQLADAAIAYYES